MANPPWARFTKPIKPMVTERPTDTMNSTIPAATPPSSMLTTSTPKIMRGCDGGRQLPKPPPAEDGRRRVTCRRRRVAVSESLRGARADLLLLARVLDPVDLADDLLVDAAVLQDRLRQILVHDDVARDRSEHDRSARAVELAPLEGRERLVRVDLALERLDHVDDRRHAVVPADRHEVGRRGGAVLLLPRVDEPLVLGIVEISV